MSDNTKISNKNRNSNNKNIQNSSSRRNSGIKRNSINDNSKLQGNIPVLRDIYFKSNKKPKLYFYYNEK